MSAPGSDRTAVRRDTQWRRREQIRDIRVAAASAVPALIDDPLWVAGVVAYWGEGAKVKRILSVTNTDPRLLRLFIAWCRAFHDPGAQFVIALHLHEGNDEAAALHHWRSVLSLPGAAATKTFVKPAGTGHRKNHLLHGVCRVSMRRSTDAWERTMAWIDALPVALAVTAAEGC